MIYGYTIFVLGFRVFGCMLPFVVEKPHGPLERLYNLLVLLPIFGRVIGWW